jgi:hypothetical protein
MEMYVVFMQGCKLIIPNKMQNFGKLYFILFLLVINIGQTSCKSKQEKAQERIEKEKVQKTWDAIDEILDKKGTPLTKDPAIFENDQNQLNKPNDIIVAVYKNPNATVYDFTSQTDLNKQNTSLFSATYYKTTKFVKDRFTVNGEFDNQRFNEFYIKASNIYMALP